MNIGIAIEIDIEADNKSVLIQEVSDALEEAFNDKNYGADIENIDIGFICVRVVPGVEDFSVKRKPKYVASQFIKLLDGSRKEVTNTFSFDVKLDDVAYESFVAASNDEATRLIIHSILASLSVFDKLPKKVKSFDADQFKLDITSYFNEQLIKV